MTDAGRDAGRRRIDVSSDVHSRLDAESKRRNIPIRDLVEQAVTTMFDREAQAALSMRQQRERRQADRMEELGGQLGDLARRVSALIAQQTKDLPSALNAGFEAIKTTIRETGGTGHLRDMIAKFQTDFTAKSTEANTAVTKSVSAVTEAVNSRGDRLEERVAELRKGLAGRRNFFGAGVATGLVFILLVGFVMPDMPPTRWLATRFVGETDPAQAAWTLAGDGRARGLLMAETKGLLNNHEFRTRYAQCVDHAKRVKAPFPCRVTFPVLNEMTP